MAGDRAPLTPRSRWLAIVGATLVLQFSYWFLLVGRAGADPAAGEEQLEAVGGAFAIGLMVAPVVFAVLAFGSRQAAPTRRSFAALGVFLVVALSLGLFSPLVGVATGFAAGGVLALSREPGVHDQRRRWIAVGVMALYLLVLQVVLPQFAVMSGAVLPLTVLGMADMLAEDRAGRA